ncbi:hypothetical protein H7Y21_03195 [Arenimonas sp.]|nr:hypothetical protein [Candidatus Parcubacteria bacterium]
MTQENHQKKIITNEDLFDHISGFKLEVKKTVDDFKSEMKESTNDLSNSILRLESSVEDLRKSTLEGFDMVFKTIDDTNSELREELKNDNIILRKEMNQRFSVVDKRFTIIDDRLTVVDDRLSSIEDNMTYKHQLSPKFA